MSSISSLGSTTSSMSMMHSMRKPDPAKMAEDLFNKLDTSGQGYLQLSDLQAAYDSISTGSSSSTTSSTDSNVSDLFSQLDSDSDGKVTKEEFSSSMSQLAQQLDEQFQSMRMQQGMGGMGGMGGMPPPPPPANDTGFTKDELSSQLEEIGSTDSTRASLLSSIIENFDAADTDGDGKVSFQEAMAYQDAKSTDSSSTAASASSTSSASSTDSQVMLQIMRLIQAYGGHGGDSMNVVGSQLSVSA